MRLADILLKPIAPGKTQPIVGMAARHRVMNTNSITLAAIIKYHYGIPFVQLEAEPADTVANYVKEIRESPAGELTALITTSNEVEDFPPTVTQTKAEAAARQLGFKVIRRFEMPDGRQLRIWVKRPRGGGAAAAPARRPQGRSNGSSSSCRPACP
jgi:hypothetical protein